MSADAPWWTSGLVGSALGVAALVVVGTAGAQIVVPLVEAPATVAAAPADPRGDDTELTAAGGYPRSASYTPPPSASASPAAAEPTPAAPAAAPAVPAAVPAASPAPTATAAQARKAARKARLRRERRAARELTALARKTFETWGPISGTWVLPVASYRRLSSHFGETGPHWKSAHGGQDFSAPTGTEVRAATAGMVTFAGWAGAYGNKLEITHPDGNVTWYAHLSRLDVAVTDQVTTGQVVGLVGDTGNTTGPHLHFEVHPDGGDAVDPLAVLKDHGVEP